MSQKQSNVQQKMAEFEAIVAWFQAEDIDIEEALATYERGMKLAAELRESLSEMQNRIKVLEKSFES